MHKQWKSMMVGAAVAALVTLPAFGADGWTNVPTRSFDAHGLSVHDLVGNLTVAVKDGPATVQVSGVQARVNALSTKVEDGTIVIEGEGSESVWDWRKWLDFSDNSGGSRSDLNVHVTIPKGSPVHVEDLVGDAQIGDTMGPMNFSAVSTNSTIGRVGETHVSLAGSGKIVIGDIAGDLHAETAGSGKIRTGNAQDVSADVAGSGSINVGAIQGLKLDIAGSGDFSATHLNGPTHVDIAGSGSVNVAGGEANPLHVDIMGSGNFTLNGVAVDPRVSAVGSGNIRLKAIRGNLVNDGMANVKIGSMD